MKTGVSYFSGLVSLACLLTSPLHADIINIYMNTAGAVPSADRTATFTALNAGTSLASYTENGLTFSQPTGSDYTAFTPAPGGFSGGFFYAGNGTYTPITISTTDNALIYGIQFNVGSGWGENTPGTDLAFIYAVFRGGVQVGSGNFDVTQTASGYLLGLSDVSGFNSLEIVHCETGPCALSSWNALAIDNVAADVTATVPEPRSAFLLGTLLLIVAAMSRFLPRIRMSLCTAIQTGHMARYIGEHHESIRFTLRMRGPGFDARSGARRRL